MDVLNTTMHQIVSHVDLSLVLRLLSKVSMQVLSRLILRLLILLLLLLGLELVPLANHFVHLAFCDDDIELLFVTV